MRCHPFRFLRASRVRRRACGVLIAAAAVAVVACRQPTAPPPAGTPRLVVLLVSDQFRYDYLERGRPFFTGGLARLLDEGASFTDAHQGHALTFTGPGHADLATGVFPSRSGIVGNHWYDRTRGSDEVYCVGDDAYGTSPRNLRVPALGDWIERRYPRSHVVSAAGKDRSAVILGGQRPDAAFWYDRDEGGFTTSPYYLRETPDWLRRFDAAGAPEDVFLHPWAPIAPVDAEKATAAGFTAAHGSPFLGPFPHLVGWASLVPGEDFYDDLYDTPVLDDWLAAFVPNLVEHYDLGGDEWPDLLALSFSALDTVGHDYGPGSLEVLDTLRRLDRSLGDLFSLLDAKLGRGAYVVAFSADHGVAPFPEVMGEPARRIGVPEVLCLRAAARGAEESFRQAHSDTFDDPWLGEPWYLDHGKLGSGEAGGAELAAVQAELAQRLQACPGVGHVWTANRLTTSTADLRTARPGSATWFEALYRNAFDPERSPDLYVQWQPFVLPQLGWQTNHGSPYGYDTHVPLIVAAPGVAPGSIDGRVLTVDLAPTLAALLDVPVPGGIDGVDRAGLLRAPDRRAEVPIGFPDGRLDPGSLQRENGFAAVRRDAVAGGSSRRGVRP